jgi:hypothetical protein
MIKSYRMIPSAIGIIIASIYEPSLSIAFSSFAQYGRLQDTHPSQFLPRRPEQDFIDVDIIGLLDREADGARE